MVEIDPFSRSQPWSLTDFQYLEVSAYILRKNEAGLFKFGMELHYLEGVDPLFMVTRAVNIFSLLEGFYIIS